jgi:hypothetical protein
MTVPFLDYFASQIFVCGIYIRSFFFICDGNSITGMPGNMKRLDNNREDKYQ